MEVEGSSPFRVATFPFRTCTKCELRAGVAQLAEQLICNQQVAGSSPFTSSISLDSRRNQFHMGRFPSGQREQTVNLPSPTSMVRIHPCPPSSAGMAELADALDSGSSESNFMQVQVLFPAPFKRPSDGRSFVYGALAKKSTSSAGGIILFRSKKNPPLL